jgi:hypothetical protein
MPLRPIIITDGVIYFSLALPHEINETENHELMPLFPHGITPGNSYWDSSLKNNNAFYKLQKPPYFYTQLTLNFMS